MSVRSELLRILEEHKGETVSGELVAEKLKCTRAAVWKAVTALRKEGYVSEAGQNRGYRLVPESSLLSKEAVSLYLEKAGIQNPQVYVFDETGSTNQEARRLVLSGEADHGAVVIARKQTAGRGRRGRSFYSPDGGIYLSVVLKPHDDINKSLMITTSAATAVYKAVKEVCGIDLDIKWVNDLYKEGKKVCGILAEADTDFETGEIRSAIVGIGINVYTDTSKIPGELKDIVGVLYEDRNAGERTDLSRLAAAVTAHLIEETRVLSISDVYIERNLIPGKQISITDGEQVRYAQAIRICEDGRLLVREEDGTENRLSYGEVSVRIKA